VKKLHEAATALAGGKTVEEVRRGLGVSPPTCHRWQKQYGGADVDTVREHKALKEENARRKRLVANQALDPQALKELAEGKWQARRGNARRCGIFSVG